MNKLEKSMTASIGSLNKSNGGKRGGKRVERKDQREEKRGEKRERREERGDEYESSQGREVD